ncbi:MAG: beta-galactosidase [Planctomycetota bacterium]|nr:MAG: beta-galactosidase [Planctomycetota bacterium]
MLLFLLLGTWIPLFAQDSTATDWQPAKGRLMTSWGAQVTPGRVHQEYPRPQLRRREWRSLNGLWDFQWQALGNSPPKEFNHRILVPFPVESALSGLGKQLGSDQELWYRSRFVVPENWRAGKLLLHFQAADWRTRVWLNGHKLGEHFGGFDPFSFEIQDHLTSGEEQLLTVAIWDPTDSGTQARGKQVSEPKGIWYTPSSGIWASVWLEPVPEVYVRKLQVQPNLDRSAVRVKAIAETGKVRVAVLDKGRPVAIAEGSANDTLELALPNPKPWSPSSPFLYDLKVVLEANGGWVDRVESYFGLRKISVEQDSNGVARIFLNNEFLFQYGLLDQGFWPDGLYAAPSDEALRFDLEKTKELGFNMVRKHVKVEPQRWYYWCDRLGLLVWQDMPSGDASVPRGKKEIDRSPESAAQFHLELQRIVEALRNHPSVVVWIPFNEGWGQFQTADTVAKLKALDPSRLVIGASGWHDFPVGDAHDIHAYPGPASPPAEASRAAVLGEFGGLGLPVKNHTWLQEGNWGYRSFTDRDSLQAAYLQKVEQLTWLIAEPGLSAAVYTQTTDVEVEVNGLLTYDRAVLKMDPDALFQAHQSLYRPIPRVEILVATSEREPQLWRYCLKAPESAWYQVDFSDSSWSSAKGGFGTGGTPGAVVGT